MSEAAPPTRVLLRRDGFVAEIMLANGPLNLVTRDLLRDLNRIIATVAKARTFAASSCMAATPAPSAPAAT